MKFTKYEKHGAYHWRQYERPGDKYRRHVDRIVRWVAERRVLDVGAGDGLILSKLGAAARGCDDEPTAIEAAKSRGIVVEPGDAYRLPYGDEAFEAVLLADVLEHLDRPEAALVEARRVLSGALYVTTPPRDITPGQLLDRFHVQEWSPEELVRLVESVGFRLEGRVVKGEKTMYAKFRKVERVVDLSVIIPARNEQWLKRTIDEVLAKRRAKTEVIAICDGAWPDPPIENHPDVTLIHYPVAIGQRAATNAGARLSTARYLMKLDAHCALDEGFDAKLIAADAPGLTQIPAMFNLHVFDWRCVACGRRTYQGPKPLVCARLPKREQEPKAEGCGGTVFEQHVVWEPRPRRRTEYWRFDHELHFQYWKRNAPAKNGEALVDVMSSIGACWFMARDRFFALGGCDEGHGSWGNYGTEWACKSWLSGGRHAVNRSTWFAHMFRTQDGFGFPYPMKGSDQDRARQYSRALWETNSWPGQVRPLSWIVEKFGPVPGWHGPEGKAALAAVLEAGEKFQRRTEA
jgi:SAM-dependent methyltransferase